MLTCYHETGGLCDAPEMQGKPRATSVHLRWNYPQYDGGAPVSDFEVQMVLSDNSGQSVFSGHCTRNWCDRPP